MLCLVENLRQSTKQATHLCLLARKKSISRVSENARLQRNRHLVLQSVKLTEDALCNRNLRNYGILMVAVAYWYT